MQGVINAVRRKDTDYYGCILMKELICLSQKRKYDYYILLPKKYFIIWEFLKIYFHTLIFSNSRSPLKHCEKNH